MELLIGSSGRRVAAQWQDEWYGNKSTGRDLSGKTHSSAAGNRSWCSGVDRYRGVPDRGQLLAPLRFEAVEFWPLASR